VKECLKFPEMKHSIYSLMVEAKIYISARLLKILVAKDIMLHNLMQLCRC